MKKQPLEPLIPLEEFGKLVGRIARVPKSAVTDRDSAKKEKREKRAIKTQ
jgi:hypothetical protein